MKKLINRFIRYVKRVIKIILRPEFKILPGQIAFFTVLSFIPMVTLVGLLASKFSIPLTNSLETLIDALPKEVTNIVFPILSSPGSISIFSMIIGFYLASNGTNSIIISSNLLFKLDDSPYLKRRIKALLMLIILVILFLFMIVVLGFGNTIFYLIMNLLKISLPSWTYYIFYVIKWCASIIVIYFLVKVILTFAPDKTIPSKKMTRGAVFITVGWCLATVCYSIYANNFANYNVFYSSLANIVVLMVWVYVLSLILVIGIAINSENYLYELKLEEELKEAEEKLKEEDQFAN